MASTLVELTAVEMATLSACEAFAACESAELWGESDDVAEAVAASWPLPAAPISTVVAVVAVRADDGESRTSPAEVLAATVDATVTVLVTGTPSLATFSPSDCVLSKAKSHAAIVVGNAFTAIICSYYFFLEIYVENIIVMS